MNEWISIKDKIPSNKQLVKIKAEYTGGESYEGTAIFTLYDIDETLEAWGWRIREGYKCTLRPTHWLPLPEPQHE